MVGVLLDGLAHGTRHLVGHDLQGLIGLHGEHINLFIEPGPPLGPVLEVTVDSVEKARAQLLKNGCEVVKYEPAFPRCYIKDPYGLIYNITS